MSIRQPVSLAASLGILTLAADRQREHPLGHDDVRDSMLFVDPDLDHLGGAQGLGHECEGILGPLDDVDLLAAQLGDDSLDARAALPDRRSNRIETLLARRDGDLRTAAGLARDRLDLDGAGVDFRNLEFEQAAQETFVGAADVDLRALGAAPDLQHIGLHVS